jgi:hypothetical protein
MNLERLLVKIGRALAPMLAIVGILSAWRAKRKRRPAVMVTGRFRDREAANIRRMHEQYPREFAIVEDALELATRIFSSRNVRPPHGDVMLGRIALGLIIKIINVFWGIICATERALPSSSQVRELAEALISLAYLLKEDSVARAQLYADRIIIQTAKDLNRILGEPELRGDITPEMQRQVDAQVQTIKDRRGAAEVKKMWDWGSWGGNFSIQGMARKAGVPPALYTMLYATESRAPHALDITSHVRLNPDGSLSATLPALAERHLMPSAITVVVALQLGTQAFGIGGFEKEIEALNQRIVEVSGV